MKRREFLKKSSVAAGVTVTAPALLSCGVSPPPSQSRVDINLDINPQDSEFSIPHHHPLPVLTVFDVNMPLYGYIVFNSREVDRVVHPVNRVLLTNQDNPVENGVWLTNSYHWRRPDDFCTYGNCGNSQVLVKSQNVVYQQEQPFSVVDKDPQTWAPEFRVNENPRYFEPIS